MKRNMAILAILAALAMPALAWADEQVPYDWEAIEQFRESSSPAITVPQSEDSSEFGDLDVVIHPEPADGDSA